jgi:hypothetical protein
MTDRRDSRLAPAPANAALKNPTAKRNQNQAQSEPSAIRTMCDQNHV